MNRAKFLMALTTGAFPLCCIGSEETPDEREVYDVLDAAIDAEFNYDFPRLVALLHPNSTKLFRHVLSARFDYLSRLFSDDTILAATGLKSHPKDVSQTDPEFFVSVCERAKAFRPDFIGDPKYLPMKIHGSVFEGDSAAYVVFSYSGSVHTERTDFDYVQPLNLTLRKVGQRWLVYSDILGRRVADLWWWQLSTPKGTRE